MSGRRQLITAAITSSLAMIALLPAFAHTASFNSKVTLNPGYGFFQGKVDSPNASCKANRSVRLFKVIEGKDDRLATTKSNSSGAWAIFRAYEEGTFYAKVAARTDKSDGHNHTCKAATSAQMAAPQRVTGDVHGWNITYYDCLDPGTPLATDAILVDGPGAPPLGFGSLQLIDPSSAFGFTTTDTEWDGLDGTPLAELRSLTFSTYATGEGPPLILDLHIDVLGDGSQTEDISFSPPAEAVELNQWQTWRATRTKTWHTTEGPTTLSEYQQAHPDAEIRDTPFGSVYLHSPCTPDNSPDYMDAVIVRTSDVTQTFDFDG